MNGVLIIIKLFYLLFHDTFNTIILGKDSRVLIGFELSETNEYPRFYIGLILETFHALENCEIVRLIFAKCNKLWNIHENISLNNLTDTASTVIVMDLTKLRGLNKSIFLILEKV